MTSPHHLSENPARATGYLRHAEQANEAALLVSIGSYAMAENAAWRLRNEKRKAFRAFLSKYYGDTGEYFDRDYCEPEEGAAYDSLNEAATSAQKALVQARAYTRRAIVRAAAKIGRA